MQDLDGLNLLIDRAVTIVGSEYRLAKELGIPPQHISNWRKGDRTCSPEDRSRLAGFAREDAVQELVRATLKKHEGTRRGEQLYKLLGKSLQATGGATVSGLLAVISLTYGLIQNHDVLYTMYIMLS